MESWRLFLYPLGFLSSIAFFFRFIVQWLYSEKEKKSIVPKSFWNISLVGNLLLVFHSLIQLQYNVAIVQTINAGISWRNLDLMKGPKNSLTLKQTLFLFGSCLSLITLIFILQGVLFSSGQIEWFRIPITPWSSSNETTIPLIWHLAGFLGLSIFSSRFWIQWWQAEKKQTSTLSKSFWIISIIGASFSIVYFVYLQDWVNAIGPSIGLFPYLRNLILIKQEKP